MKGYIVKDNDTGKPVPGNHRDSFIVFNTKAQADDEAHYLNERAPSAQFRGRYEVKMLQVYI